MTNFENRLIINHYKSSSFEEMAFQLTEVDEMNVETDVNLTGCVVRMQLRERPGSPVALNLTSVSNAGIQITTPLEGRFVILEQKIDIDAKKYQFDIFVDFPDNTTRPFAVGDFIVEDNITRV